MVVPERYEIYFYSIMETRRAVDTLDKHREWGWDPVFAERDLKNAQKREHDERCKLFGKGIT